MNFAELLSFESQAMDEMELDGERNGLETRNNSIEVTQPNNGVYNLPTKLSPLQRDLIEMVTHLFLNEISDEIMENKRKTAISNLLEDDSSTTEEKFLGANETRSKKIALFLEQLKVISRNPSLVVDHYMTKKLLLLETHETMLSLSGTFQLFSRLIDSLMERTSRKESRTTGDNKSFNILVIAKSVTELAPIESLIIGKEVKYHNLSSEKLYEDKLQVETNENAEKSQKFRKNKRKYDEMESSSNDSELGLTLYLITSHKLYNNFISYSDNLDSKFKSIISFDPDLDTKNPSLEFIREVSALNEKSSLSSGKELSLKTPILMLIPIYSIDHIILYLSGTRRTDNSLSEKSKEDYKWKLQVLKAFTYNRPKLHSSDGLDFYLKIYGKNLYKLSKWISNWGNMDYPFEGDNAMQSFDDELLYSFSDDKLLAELNKNHLLEPRNMHSQNGNAEALDDKKNHYFIEHFNYKAYKAKLGEFVNERITEMESAIISRSNELEKIRTSESDRQDHIDKAEEIILENYKKLRILNDRALIYERKLERVDSEVLKLQERKQNLSEKVVFLKNALKEPAEEDSFYKTLADQRALIGDLKKEVEATNNGITVLDEEADKWKNNYLNSSGKAATLSSNLSGLQETNRKLTSKLRGPGAASIPSLVRDEILSKCRIKLDRLKRRNAFSNDFYEKKLNENVKERNSIIKSVNELSGNRNNSRITGTRSSTPY